MKDDEKIVEMTVHGKNNVTFRSRRVVLEGEVLDPEVDNRVPKQDEWYDGGYYVRPRPPGFTKSNKLYSRSLRYGAYEMGVARVVVDNLPTGMPEGLVLSRRVDRQAYLRVELWYRNPNTGELRIMGDCLPVSYVTERDGVEAEHDFHDWQRALGIPEHRILRTMEDAMRGSGKGPMKIEPTAGLLDEAAEKPPVQKALGPKKTQLTDGGSDDREA